VAPKNHQKTRQIPAKKQKIKNCAKLKFISDTSELTLFQWKFYLFWWIFWIIVFCLEAWLTDKINSILLLDPSTSWRFIFWTDSNFKFNFNEMKNLFDFLMDWLLD
jgi:hypothetical protein